MNYEETELTLGLPGGTKRAWTWCESQKKKAKKDSRAQVVGWPPVKNFVMMKGRSRYVKVGVDGAPFLRKVDIQSYKSYDELLSGLQDLFGGRCFKVGSVNGVEYVPTYEDKDGDWMLLGDVPWNMFAHSCKRLRLMTRSEAIEYCMTNTNPTSASPSFSKVLPG